jgi:hypothetical protein
VNVCAACGERFGAVRSFDRHRVGVHAFTYREGLAMDPRREDGRRCLSVPELELQGFVRNAFGAWTLAQTLERGRAFSRRTPDGAHVEAKHDREETA